MSAPAETAAAARQVVVNDTTEVITLYCSDCPRDGVVVQPSSQQVFVRDTSDYVRFERRDGSATCIGYGSTTGAGQDVLVTDNELLVSQGGTCPAEFSRPS